jgi:hypothetical protein
MVSYHTKLSHQVITLSYHTKVKDKPFSSGVSSTLDDSASRKANNEYQVFGVVGFSFLTIQIHNAVRLCKATEKKGKFGLVWNTTKSKVFFSSPFKSMSLSVSALHTTKALRAYKVKQLGRRAYH